MPVRCERREKEDSRGRGGGRPSPSRRRLLGVGGAQISAIVCAGEVAEEVEHSGQCPLFESAIVMLELLYLAAQEFAAFAQLQLLRRSEVAKVVDQLRLGKFDLVPVRIEVFSVHMPSRLRLRRGSKRIERPLSAWPRALPNFSSVGGTSTGKPALRKSLAARAAVVGVVAHPCDENERRLIRDQWRPNCAVGRSALRRCSFARLFLQREDEAIFADGEADPFCWRAA